MRNTDELNKYRCPAGWLDFDYLYDARKARAADTLTLYSCADLGPHSIAASMLIADLARRKIVIDCQAVCDHPHELIGTHQQWVRKGKNRKMMDARQESGKTGGRPDKLTEAIAAYNRIQDGELTINEIDDLGVGCSESTFRRHVAALGWPLPQRGNDRG